MPVPASLLHLHERGFPCAERISHGGIPAGDGRAVADTGTLDGMTQQQTVDEPCRACVSCGGRGGKFVLPRRGLVAVRSEGAREPLAVLGLEPCPLCVGTGVQAA
ncbi:hypothetical protein Acsp03_39530 [Actinomadura sp. NBRC 104412]|nr:hypothetical protein Acsp03_39530 [Actinomadura sp. NBRC 104412]